MFDKTLFGTEFAFGASVALITFTVLYALSAGVTIDQLTIPDSIPIEILAGIVGVVAIIVAALWMARREPEKTSGESLLTDSSSDEGSGSDQQPRQPQGPTGGSTESEPGSGSGSESVNTARNANINNDGVNSADSNTDRPSDTHSRRESTEQPSQATKTRDDRTEESDRQRRARDTDRPELKENEGRSRNRVNEDASNPQTDSDDNSDDNSETSDEYRRRLAGINGKSRSRDE